MLRDATEVEPRHFLEHWKPRGADQADLPVVLTLGDLVLSQGEQKLFVALVGLGGIRCELAIVRDKAGEAQLFEIGFQQQLLFHGYTLSSNWS